MPRNTNINDLLFEVKELPVYVDGTKTPVPGFKAIAGYPEKDRYDNPLVFSVVSEGYHLVSNCQALELGKKLHRRLFPEASDASFAVFNIIAPNTRSFCNIDIIDSHYQLNIHKSEVYLPFIRIRNSYNRISALRFDLGFCRKLCNNGVIFEQNTVTFRYNHNKQIRDFEDFTYVDTTHLTAMVNDFSEKILFSTELALPKEYFVAMAAYIFDKQFAIDDEDPYVRWEAENKLDEFAKIIYTLANPYLNDFGETAYTLYNIATDYASNIKHPAVAINDLQQRCGTFLKSLKWLTEHNDFNWFDLLGPFQKYLPESLRKK